MCWKKEPLAIINPADFRLLTFGRNKYGGSNNLNGCVNDSNNLPKKPVQFFPKVDVRKFFDYDVTVYNYLTNIEASIKTLSSGAVSFVMADSCFSESITRAMGIGFISKKHPTKSRFLYPGIPPRRKRNVLFKGVLNHIVMSGCQEHQTSADAYINGQYVGALTCFASLALEKEMTYREWFNETRRYLPSRDFDQVPTLEGPDWMLDSIIGDKETLWIHNSSHGSYTYDKNGDEEDGQDEGLYFDRLLIDDEIGNVLKQIRA